MIARIVISALLATAVTTSTAHAQRMQRRELELMVGEQTSLAAEGVQSYSEGAPGIIDVRVTSDGTQFVVVALAPGITTLLFIYADRQVQYRVTVRSDEEPADEVGEKDNIRLDFYFIQLVESYGHNIGIGWPSSIGGGSINFNATLDLLQPAVTNATATLTNQPLPRLDLLQSTGWARVLRQAALITANGNQATFASNEEVNVPIAGALTAELRTITFGSTVGVTPNYDRETGRIELQLSAEVSQITPGRGTGVPGRTVANVDTRVNLEMGQAVVLGGLLAESQAMDQSGLPGLSQIPILGIFFGTNTTSREYTENVLFIVPSVVDVVSQQARQRIADALNVYWDYTGGLHDIQLLDMPAGTPTAAHPDARDNAPAARPARRDGN